MKKGIKALKRGYYQLMMKYCLWRALRCQSKRTRDWWLDEKLDYNVKWLLNC